MANKRKVTTAIAAGVTAAALLLGGTFAWQSINQTALNEASDVINPGGRLHDDFNGSNKDVYVENFADEDIFARIRLDEYFEIIMNKGVEGAERIDSIAGEKDEDGNIIAWETHKFDGSDATAEYWEWASGGSTVYMPTFNKNKDSLAADVNGTYQGVDGVVTDDATDDRYTDYVTYEAGEPKTGNAIYDIDANMADELTEGDVDIAGLIDGTLTADGYTDNVTLVPEEHTAQSTLGATLISMADWMALPEDQQVGEYWVYDTDGWVYWAQPIKPGTATGKLLDSIKLTQVMDDSWYYAINVVAQFITADDLGKTDGTGFYDAENGAIPSDNALALLEKIGVDTTGEAGGESGGDNIVQPLPIREANGLTEVKTSNEYILYVESGYTDVANLVYSVDSDVSTAEAITYEEGTHEYAAVAKLTVGANETAQKLTVTVTDSQNQNAYGSVEFTVLDGRISVTTEDGTELPVRLIEDSPTVLAKDYLGKTLILTLADEQETTFNVDTPGTNGSTIDTIDGSQYELWNKYNSVKLNLVENEQGWGRKAIDGVLYYYINIPIGNYDPEVEVYHLDVATKALTTVGLSVEISDTEEQLTYNEEDGCYYVKKGSSYTIKNKENFGLEWSISDSDKATLTSDNSTATIAVSDTAAVGDEFTVTTEIENLVDTIKFVVEE